MANSDIVAGIMFDYEAMTKAELLERLGRLPPKIARWIATHHPDNRTRKTIFRATGVEVGAGAVLNPMLSISDSFENLVSIGERASVAQNVTIVADSAPNNSTLSGLLSVQPLIVRAPVVLRNDCWIGACVTILPGVTIGSHAVVGAGSVVTKDVPEKTIAAGAPARVIRSIDQA
jgi:maltose O-acetyltransferase